MDSGRFMSNVSTLGRRAPGSLDEAIDRYKQGIDETLIAVTLKLTIDQRLEELQRLYDFAEELRSAGLRKEPLS
jgi:hypothetical protein